MLKTGDIAGRLHRCLLEKSRSCDVERITPGEHYLAVLLSGDRFGISARLRRHPGDPVQIASKPEWLAGDPADRVTGLLTAGKTEFERSLGLAAVNALIEVPVPEIETDAIDLIGLRPGERVAMVGLFRPLVQKIEATGARLTVIELDTPRDERTEALASCDAAVITATTLLNGTLEETLSMLRSPRHVAVLGPSTPLLPEAFSGTPVTHLGGSIVADRENVLRVIAAGGGTPAMRPWLRFVNLRVEKPT